MKQNRERSFPVRISAADLFLVVFLIAVSLLGFCRARKHRQRGNFCLIEIDGAAAYRLPLDADTLLSIKARTGKVTLALNGGKVCVRQTTCPLRICERTGWIDLPGQAIICVPNRMVLTIEGGKKGTIDAVTE